MVCYSNFVSKLFFLFWKYIRVDTIAVPNLTNRRRHRCIVQNLATGWRHRCIVPDLATRRRHYCVVPVLVTRRRHRCIVSDLAMRQRYRCMIQNLATRCHHRCVVIRAVAAVFSTSIHRMLRVLLLLLLLCHVFTSSQSQLQPSIVSAILYL